MPTVERTLVVVRHARASQEGADFDRDLEPEGARAALAAGRWLAAEGYVADAALVSAARRAERTWASLSEGAAWSAEPLLDRALYHADAESALDLVRETDEGSHCLVVVGHNPTVATMAQLLDDGEGDVATGLAMAGGYPPASLAVFTFPGPWRELGWAGARLVAFREGERG
ncbi:MAG: histidine phosphatase family protein [Nocardioides sp.]|uniref:SixA phosphatase family protein n=1 Tax=Nocardioides sp. TaxID=35761 RepID=UPI0039E40A05